MPSGARKNFFPSHECHCILKVFFFAFPWSIWTMVTNKAGGGVGWGALLLQLVLRKPRSSGLEVQEGLFFPDIIQVRTVGVCAFSCSVFPSNLWVLLAFQVLCLVAVCSRITMNLGACGRCDIQEAVAISNCCCAASTIMQFQWQHFFHHPLMLVPGAADPVTLP